MKFKQFARAFAPIAGIALAAAVAGCDGATIKLNDEEGKKLSELDLSGPAPEELVVAGPDEVQVSLGEKLAITVDGDPDAAAKMRFTLKDGTLGVLREGKLFDRDGGKVAVIHVTMPAPKQVMMAGSGKVVAATLARSAKVTVAGSGLVETASLDGDSLELTIAGSGSYRGAGKVTALDLNVAGSGAAQLDALRVDKAKVSIAGSGGVAFTSDGEVDAKIMGSGEVKVKGRARCKVSSMGSGRLVCETPVENADPDDDAATAEPSGTPG